MSLRLPRPRAGRLSLLACLAAAAVPTAATADSAPDAGTAFEPAPASLPLFGTQPPSADPARQQHVLTASDGVRLYTETWLPAPKDGRTPPDRHPTILIATPYVTQGVERYPSRNLHPAIAYFTSRGYAVAQHHVRGTGDSGGCLEQTSDQQIDDVARVIEHLGRDAPWSNGAVGMYGHSYDAETQVSVAGRGAPEKVRYLKAIVPSATVGGQYEYSNYDGVPYAGWAALSNGLYLADSFSGAGPTAGPKEFAEKPTCVAELGVMAADVTGNMNPFWAKREYRPGAPDITAATLWVHGLADWNVQPITIAGFFDRLPATTPKAGLFGVWEHNFPDKHAVQPDWARPDFLPMVTAWYDRHLKGLDTGTDAWPTVQLQGSDGQWRAARGFPRVGGPAGQLALGAGTLGTAAPSGSTTFREGPEDANRVPGTRAVFTSEPFAARLHVSGQPVVDLWLSTDRPDGHLVAKLEVLDPDGRPLRHDGGNAAVADYGARSLQHLAPQPDDFFTQSAQTLPPVGTPIRVPLRLQPADLVVPAGGRLRLTLSGATTSPRPTVPSGTASTIEVLHDCAHPSALRFLMPDASDRLLNVREIDEDAGPLPSAPATAGVRDGGGAATAPVCGAAPLDPQHVTRGTADAAPAHGRPAQGRDARSGRRPARR